MSEVPELAGAVWRKSSYSNADGGQCVEVAPLVNGGVAIRDSKDPHSGVLTFTAAEWRAFVNGTKAGEFD
jgi:hypothetical protein